MILLCNVDRLKTILGLDCPSPALKKHVFCKYAKDTKQRPLSKFRFCCFSLEFLLENVY